MEIQKEYSRRPDRELNFKPIRMMFKFIGQQCNPLPSTKRITLQDINENITTKKKSMLYTRFSTAQFELITLFNRVIRLTKSAEKSINPIIKYNDENIKFIFYMAFKEAYSIALIFQQLGIVWHVKELEALGDKYIDILQSYKEQIEKADNTGFKFNNPLVSDKVIESLKTDLRRVDMLAPLLVSYYQSLADLEQLVRLDYE